MSMVKRAMTYLGLGPDEDYADDVEPAPASAPAPVASSEGGGLRTLARPTTRTAEAPPAAPQPRRPVTGSPEPTGTATQQQPRVRPLNPPQARVEVFSPKDFNDAQGVADNFKDGRAVIVNLQSAHRDLSRRLIDFTSGLCYGLGGRMERVANNVYLLTPEAVEVSAEEKRRLADSGLID